MWKDVPKYQRYLTHVLSGVYFVTHAEKSVKIPIILFPNNITGITRYADAIWFMSLLNSCDPYFIIGAQVLGAPIIKKFNYGLVNRL